MWVVAVLIGQCGSSGGSLTLQDFVYVPIQLDDIFHAQDSEDQVLVTRDASIQLHLQLGFILNLAKSSLVPSQVMTHLGADLNTLAGVVRPTPDKIREISHRSQALLDIGFTPAKHLQQVVGLMASCYATVPLCLFHLRLISSHLARSFVTRTNMKMTVLQPSPRSLSLPGRCPAACRTRGLL